jgi:hypothetical protein
MITVISILIGAVLGTRYKVFCLVPITLAGIVALATLDQLNEAPLSSTALSALALVVGLQIGYFVGITVRSVLLAAHAGSVSKPGRLRDQPARIS